MTDFSKISNRFAINGKSDNGICFFFRSFVFGHFSGHSFLRRPGTGRSLPSMTGATALHHTRTLWAFVGLYGPLIVREYALQCVVREVTAICRILDRQGVRGLPGGYTQRVLPDVRPPQRRSGGCALDSARRPGRGCFGTARPGSGPGWA